MTQQELWIVKHETGKEADRLREDIEGLIAALNLALRYLEHPDVQEMPFAFSAKAAARRVRAAIAKARNE